MVCIACHFERCQHHVFPRSPQLLVERTLLFSGRRHQSVRILSISVAAAGLCLKLSIDEFGRHRMEETWRVTEASHLLSDEQSEKNRRKSLLGEHTEDRRACGFVSEGRISESVTCVNVYAGGKFRVPGVGYAPARSRGDAVFVCV